MRYRAAESAVRSARDMMVATLGDGGSRGHPLLSEGEGQGKGSVGMTDPLEAVWMLHETGWMVEEE